MATEENVKRIGGTVGWGLAGGVLLGPAGLLAGLLLGGRKKNITFVARFRDGRRLLATTDSETYRKLQAAAFDQPKPRPIIPESDGDTGPGRFRIVGVERESGNDTALSIDAESPANAKVKAELKGIVVTSVTRDPS